MNVTEKAKLLTQTYSNPQSEIPTIVEVFCVDVSLSMAKSQNFPYILGESKLNLCKRILMEPIQLPPDQCHHTALVTFHTYPELSVPFALQSDEQNQKFRACLDSVVLQKGSSIFSSYAFCEDIASKYLQQFEVSEGKVIIHLFTDGQDTSSLPTDVTKYSYVQSNSSTSVSSDSSSSSSYISSSQLGDHLKQSFLYSFDTNIAPSTDLAKALNAHLIVVQDSDVAKALQERQKWILKSMPKPSRSKAPNGFNLAKGYTPDLVELWRALHKAYHFFLSSQYVTVEGLFRLNAHVGEAQDLSNRLLAGKEVMSDFEDAISVAHALKTAIKNSPPILPIQTRNELMEIKDPSSFTAGTDSSSGPSGSQARLSAVKKCLEDTMPHVNLECLHVLLYLLHRVADNSAENKMTSTNISLIFTLLLFPNLITLDPHLTTLLKDMIDHVSLIFPSIPATTGNVPENYNLNSSNSSSPTSQSSCGRPEPSQSPPSQFQSTSRSLHRNPSWREANSSDITQAYPSSSSQTLNIPDNYTPTVKRDAIIVATEHKALGSSGNSNPVLSETSPSYSASSLSTSLNHETLQISPRSLRSEESKFPTPKDFQRPLPPYLREGGTSIPPPWAVKQDELNPVHRTSSPTLVQEAGNAPSKSSSRPTSPRQQIPSD